MIRADAERLVPPQPADAWSEAVTRLFPRLHAGADRPPA